jgi:hypothetical protein
MSTQKWEDFRMEASSISLRALKYICWIINLLEEEKCDIKWQNLHKRRTESADRAIQHILQQ